MKSLLSLFICLILPGCMGIPKGISPVTNFDVGRYLGTWYEIARLDHSFERGLEKVTAQYSLKEDGGLRVVNRGFDPKSKTWKEAIGKAYSLKDPQLGKLKVSFWGPFYGAYNIIDLDHKNYSYAVVCGPNTSYFWILSRQPHMASALKLLLIEKAGNLGFNTNELVHVKH
jgi:apolipoprotein D and lipocalin family protein